MRPRFLILLLVCATATAADRNLFDYDAQAPLQVKVSSSRREGGITIRDVVYASPKGGPVPASLVLPPPAAEPAPAIVFQHWGLGDRHAFLDEARTFARLGVASLLIDAPFVRPAPWRKDAPDEEDDQLIQSVIDVRRGLDLLASEPAIDSARFAFVGLSHGAHVGALLAGTEGRFRAFVLMGGLAASSEMVDPLPPGITQQQWNEFLDDFAALDAEKWVARPRQAPVFLQFARKDEFVDESQASRLIDAASPPQVFKWYEGGHEFNVSSRRDRMSWLATILGFPLPEAGYYPVAASEAASSSLGRYAELSKFGVVIDIPGMSSVPVRRDVVYKRTGWGELKLDVYYPFAMEPQSRVPAVILISGQAGEPLMRNLRGVAFNTTLARTLTARANRIVVVPDIRPTWTSLTDPSSENTRLTDVSGDIEDLLSFLRSHAGELKIDGESLAIWVRSAGWSYGLRAALRDPALKAIVAYSPQLSSEPLRGTGLKDALLPEYSPLELLKKSTAAPPFLLVTAGRDPFYNAMELSSFKAAAMARSYPLTHIHLPDGEHGFEVVNDEAKSRQALLETFLFLRHSLPLRPAQSVE